MYAQKTLDPLAYLVGEQTIDDIPFPEWAAKQIEEREQTIDELNDDLRDVVTQCDALEKKIQVAKMKSFSPRRFREINTMQNEVIDHEAQITEMLAELEQLEDYPTFSGGMPQ